MKINNRVKRNINLAFAVVAVINFVGQLINLIADERLDNPDWQPAICSIICLLVSVLS